MEGNWSWKVRRAMGEIISPAALIKAGHKFLANKPELRSSLTASF